MTTQLQWRILEEDLFRRHLAWPQQAQTLHLSLVVAPKLAVGVVPDPACPDPACPHIACPDPG